MIQPSHVQSQMHYIFNQVIHCPRGFLFFVWFFFSAVGCSKYKLTMDHELKYVSIEISALSEIYHRTHSTPHSTQAQGALQNRRWIEYNYCRMRKHALKCEVYWTECGCHTQEFTGSMITCTKLYQSRIPHGWGKSTLSEELSTGNG